MKTINFFSLICVGWFLLACGESVTQTDATVTPPVTLNDTTATVGAVPAGVSPTDCKRFDKTIYRYKYEVKPDSLAFHILFNCNNDSLQGLMFGVAEEGEHGIYFFKSTVEELTVSGDSISFSIVQGKLYSRAFTLDNYDKNLPKTHTGGYHGRIFYRGKLAGDSITLKCQSEDGMCYDHTLVFKKQV